MLASHDTHAGTRGTSWEFPRDLSKKRNYLLSMYITRFYIQVGYPLVLQSRLGGKLLRI